MGRPAFSSTVTLNSSQRLQFVGHLDLRLQPGAGILHQDRDHAVEADGRVALLARVRLQQGDMHVDVGAHALVEFDGEAVLAGLGADPHLLQDRRVVLQRDQRPALGSVGKEDDRLFAHQVALLVGAEIEPRGAAALFLAGAAGPARPVDVDDLAGGMAALRVDHADQVAAPVRVFDLEFPLPDAVLVATTRLQDSGTWLELETYWARESPLLSHHHFHSTL